MARLHEPHGQLYPVRQVSEYHYIMSKHLTFRDLDGNVTMPPPSSALEEWYRNVRDIELGNLNVGDLSRSCRQNLYLDYIVAISLETLETNPLAGAMYDGELAQALKKVPAGYWQSHSAERIFFINLAEQAYEQTEDEDLLITEADLVMTSY